MNIAVCVKQIPSPATPQELVPPTFALARGGDVVIDDADRFGVEVALQLRDAVGGGEVIAVSMSPDQVTAGLHTALAMGADRAVLASDSALAGSDALATGRVLAACVRRAGDVQLVISGTESTDGYTGTVPAQVAALLGWPCGTFAKSVELEGNRVRIQRQTDAGYDVAESELPAVISVTAGWVEPRYPSFKGIMGAKNKPIDVVSVSDLGLSPEEVGWRGARQEIVDVIDVPVRSAGEKIIDDGTGYERIIAFLEQARLL